MAIQVPIKRHKMRSARGSSKRNVVAVLSLTAMVDMFTVLAVFLLQNYAATGEIIRLPKEVVLPRAGKVKDLKPSNVVTISKDGVFLNSESIMSSEDLKSSKDLMIKNLRVKVEGLVKKGELDKKSFINKAKKVINNKINTEGLEEEVDSFRKITIQAHKDSKFLSIKKIMFTVTEAGIYEINFAVTKRKSEEESL